MRVSSTDLYSGCRRAQLIGIMMIVAIGAYAYILDFIARGRAPFGGFAPSSPIDVLRLVFTVMALADLVVIQILTRQMIAATPARRTLGASGPPPVGQRLLSLSITRLATCESIAVLGGALFLLGGRMSDFYGFAAVSLGALVFHFPRASQWEEWARQLPA